MNKKPVESNYEITKKRVQKKFVEYDQENMIRKFDLEYDDDYLYIFFVKRKYRVDRKNGKVEWSEDGFLHTTDASYDEAMSIYDVLCCSKENCCLSGEFAPIDSVKRTFVSADSGGGFFGKSARMFDQKKEKFEKACEHLGGIREGIGDLSFRLDTFEFLPVIVEFWESDEEFEAKLQILWDKNTMDYIDYETSFFVASHLLRRISELMEEM